MNDLNVAHPNSEQLQAYSLGDLAPEDSAEIDRHLAVCDVCQQALNISLGNLPGQERNPSGEGAATSAPLSPDCGQTAATVAYTPSECPPSAGAAGDPLAGSEVPEELANHPRYCVLERRGAGGMGTVYKAEHLLMRRLVALKVINRNLVGQLAAVERFRREIQAAARLSHPNIVTAYDADQAGTTHFLVMEFVQGMSMDQVIAEQGPLPVGRACDYARQVALGMHHAYERGMVHRDIKPHNLMLTPDGQVKILDFGLARLAMESGLLGKSTAGSSAGDANTYLGAEPGGAITEAGSMMGTVDYLAPEQAHDARQADIRADIYSLGCTLYHFLAGHPPFPGGTLGDKVTAHAQQTPKPLTALRGDVPTRLAGVVSRMMSKEPAQRYQTPGEVVKALVPFAGVTPAEPRRKRILSAVAVTVLLTLLVFWGYWTGPDVYRFATNQGQLVIETEAENVKVVIRQGGKEVGVIDANTDRAINLKAGTYQLALAGERERVQLSPETVTLYRNDRQVIRVSARSVVPQQAPRFGPNAPPPRGPGPGRLGGKSMVGPNPPSPRNLETNPGQPSPDAGKQ